MREERFYKKGGRRMHTRKPYIYILYEYLRPEVYGETLKRDDTFVTSSSRFLPQFSLIRCTILYELA